MYIKHLSYYALKLGASGIQNIRIKKLILFAISVIISNTEFSEFDFFSLQSLFHNELSKIISEYKNNCKKIGAKPEILHPILKYEKQDDITTFIQLGESEFNKKNEVLTPEKQNLCKIIFYVIKSLCINIINASNYEINTDEDYVEILKKLNSLAVLNDSEDDLKKILTEISLRDFNLMKNIRNAQAEKYGEQTETEVSYSTTPGKAILVVGSDFHELEKILKTLKFYDIYTHDEMLTAHTFPKLREYPNLKGQYGVGFENCLIDFSTFPGPIILTRNSLYNVENFYRGRLFTTDFAHTKGIIQIINDDFSEVIKSAEESKGFKTGKHCESEQVGFNYNEFTNKILQDIKEKNYSVILILGNPEGQKNIENYYKQLTEHIPPHVYIISLFCCKEKENITCVNALYDNYALPYLAEKLACKKDINLYVFIPVCKRHTITDLVYLAEKKNINIFWNSSFCTSINPSVTKTLSDMLKINAITVPKKDMEKLI